jgi:hypothetical protein
LSEILLEVRKILGEPHKAAGAAMMAHCEELAGEGAILGAIGQANPATRSKRICNAAFCQPIIIYPLNI